MTDRMKIPAIGLIDEMLTISDRCRNLHMGTCLENMAQRLAQGLQQAPASSASARLFSKRPPRNRLNAGLVHPLILRKCEIALRRRQRRSLCEFLDATATQG